MSFMRSKSVLISSLSAAALLLAGSIVLFVQGRRGAEQARAARDRARRDLERFYAQDPFPTEQNIERIRAQAALLNDWYEQVSEVLREGQVSTPDLSPAVFIERLNAQVNALRRSSPRVAGDRVVTEVFRFGFDAYLGSDAALPEPEHVGRLAYQLQLVRILVEMAYDSGVMRIASISRDVFERETDPARERAPRREGRAPDVRRSSAARSGRDFDGSAESALFERERIRMSLRVRPDALSELLNHLSRMQPLATVEFLSVRKSGPDIRPIQSAAAAPRTQDLIPGMPAPDEALSPLEMPREQRLISGPDRDPPLDVNIEIDIYHFKGD